MRILFTCLVFSVPFYSRLQVSSALERPVPCQTFPPPNLPPRPRQSSTTKNKKVSEIPSPEREREREREREACGGDGEGRGGVKVGRPLELMEVASDKQSNPSYLLSSLFASFGAFHMKKC